LKKPYVVRNARRGVCSYGGNRSTGICYEMQEALYVYRNARRGMLRWKLEATCHNADGYATL
jgi:hypothetical protein